MEVGSVGGELFRGDGFLGASHSVFRFQLYHEEGAQSGFDRGKWLRGKEEILENGCD
jgi:hypothetical protein